MGMNGVPRGVPTLSDASGLAARGKNVAVVGGTGGLGRAIARLLAARGAMVTVVGRTFRDKGVANLDFVAADLATVAGAEEAAGRLIPEGLDLLVFTTGIMSNKTRQTSPDGIELDLAVSYISRFVMLRAVADRLGDHREGHSRVFVMGFPGTDELGDPTDLNAEESYGQLAAHMNTVAANEALVLATAARFPKLGVFGLNPGLVKTNIRGNALGGTSSIRFKVVESVIGWFTPTPERYAETIVPVLLASELDGESGFHFNKRGTPITPSAGMDSACVAAFTDATLKLLSRV